MNKPSLENAILTSEWMGLSPHLIASFYQVERSSEDSSNYSRTQNTDPVTVKAPLSEANMEISLSWQSAFEHSGPENRAPTLLAMLQSGAFKPLIDAVSDFAGGKNNPESSIAARAQAESNRFIKQFEGRTGITKLNSTQVFNGMPPVKFQITALFRAWADPLAEVEEPFDKLMQWALPVKLSNDGTVLARSISAAAGGDNGFIDTLVPSIAPVTIAMKYKGRTYSPLVIESISKPISSPVDVNGRYVEMPVQMTLGTLTAIDRDDWSNYKTVKI